MARRSVTYYLIKTTRVSGWFLLVAVLLCMVSGLSMCGQLGFENLMSDATALAIHKTFVWPLLVLFLVHSFTSVYLALRRWGWIGKRTKT